MFVRPAPGLTILRPDTHAVLPAAGADVPDTAWCLRGIKSGDLLLGPGTSTPTPTPVPTPSPTPTPTPVPTPSPTPTPTGTSYTLPIATGTTLGGVKGGGNVSIGSDGTLNAASSGGTAYTLPAATASALGGVKIGANLTVASDGTLSGPAPSGTSYTLPAATASVLGGVKIGVAGGAPVLDTNIKVATANIPAATSSAIGGVKPGTGLTVAADGTLNSTASGGTSYTLTAATASALGGVKVGNGLTVATDGTLSTSGTGGTAYTLPAATASALGGVKAGSGTGVATDGTISTSLALPTQQVLSAAGAIDPTFDLIRLTAPNAAYTLPLGAANRMISVINESTGPVTVALTSLDGNSLTLQPHRGYQLQMPPSYQAWRILAPLGASMGVSGPVITTYTGSGTIPATDDVSIINSATPVSITLAATVAGVDHKQQIRCLGAGAVTFTNTFFNGNSDFTPGTIPAQPQGVILDVLMFNGQWWVN